MDFDPGPGTQYLTKRGITDFFVSKLDSGGNFVWAKRIGVPSSVTTCSDLCIDPAGDLLLTGSFNGTVNFDPGVGVFNLTSNNINFSAFICKWDDGGNFKWAKATQGPGRSMSTSSTADPEGMIYSTGWFVGTVDFDPDSSVVNLTSTGSSDIFVKKVDTAGSLIWARNMGGVGIDQSEAIACDRSGNIHFTGSFSGNTDFNPGSGIYHLGSAGGKDIFVTKWGCASSGIDRQVACQSFLWIDSITYTKSTSAATFRIQQGSSNGCDSLVLLDLIIKNADTGVSKSGATLVANTMGAKYQWIDCGNGNQLIAGDTSQTFTAAANGSYAVVVTANGCTDTSRCYLVDNVGIEEWGLSRIEVYPNPTSRSLTIKRLDGKANVINYTINTVTGKTILKGHFMAGGETEVDFTNESPGLYFITVTDGDNFSTCKIVKK